MFDCDETKRHDANRLLFYGDISEDEQSKRGEYIAKSLKLKRDPEHKDRYSTAWGTKTALGLFRTLQAALEGIITESEQS